MRFTLAVCLVFLTTAATADTVDEVLPRVVDDHATPAVEGFAAAAMGLEAMAAQECLPEAVQPAYHAAFDAWMAVQHLNMGPIERDGRLLAIAFWPDKKGLIPRTLSGFIAEEDPVIADAEGFAHASIAVRGFFALDYLLYDPAFSNYAAGSYTCHLVQAISHDINRMAGEIAMEWTGEGGFAETLKRAGEATQVQYFTPHESVQALYTMLTASLAFSRDQRIKRPIGSFERPRPKRAEAWRSVRSQRNLMLAFEADLDLARKLAPGEIPQVEAGFADLIALTKALEEPSFADVSDPMQRFKLEIIGQRIDIVLGHIANEIGAPMGVSAGFNAGDGD